MHGKTFVVQKAQVGVLILSLQCRVTGQVTHLFCEEGLMLSTNDIIIHLHAIHELECCSLKHMIPLSPCLITILPILRRSKLRLQKEKAKYY